ncbi:MAG: HEAT repeat domain-containing protein [Anaerolineae bacterium]|nr:HEAT repeat domain-containing protein [Anaerolineae bacterium]
MTDIYDPERNGDDLQEDERDERPRPEIDETIAALRDAEAGGLSVTVYYGLSDLKPAGVEQLRDAWESLDSAYRSRLMEQLVDISEMNFDLDYNALAYLSLDDENPDVRAAAIELLWADETLPTMNRLIQLALDDDSVPVRAAAAGSLGRYILLGEYEELPATQTDTAVDAALSIYNDHDEDIEVRRRALESLGNSSHIAVSDLIEEAYASMEQPLRVSALFAMGRTCDPKWEHTVMRELNSGDAELRYEAVRAAGEIGLDNAVPKLARMVYDNDREIKEVSIWALGEIGGNEATNALERLTTDPDFLEDEDLQEALEDALLSAAMPGADMALLELDDDPFYDDDDDEELDFGDDDELDVDVDDDELD